MVLQEPETLLTVGTRRAAVLGSPIHHSLSPALHRAAYRALGLQGWAYGMHEVRGSELGSYVQGLGPEWAGLSLTMPLKEEAFEVADKVSDLARRVGAINTLVHNPDGGWTGDNTDVYGVSQALREAGSAEVASALVLGSGATARAVVTALATLGCQSVTFAVRSEARPESVQHARSAGLQVHVMKLSRFADAVDDAQAVVSTLPANALTGVRLPEGSSLRGRFLLDVVYADWPTPLARTFERAGASVVSGLEMLVHQAAQQVHLMTGLQPPVEQMRAAGLAALESR
jgi:shikimate dehydrogenase